jgi:hypothetical protein
MSYKYINIFDDLYQIKDSISEGIYIKLNNDIKNILCDLDKHYKCNCDKINLNVTGNIFNYNLCHYEDLKHCNNFKLLCYYCPQMNYIYDKTNINYSSIPRNSNIRNNVIIFNNFISLSLSLINILDNEDKAYAILGLYNFLIDNYNLLIQYSNNDFKEVIKRKFNEISNDKYVIELIKRHNINYNEWYKLFSKI